MHITQVYVHASKRNFECSQYTQILIQQICQTIGYNRLKSARFLWKFASLATLFFLVLFCYCILRRNKCYRGPISDLEVGYFGFYFYVFVRERALNVCYKKSIVLNNQILGPDEFMNTIFSHSVLCHHANVETKTYDGDGELASIRR